MDSVPQVCQALRQVLEQDAAPLARAAGLRERSIPFSALAQVFVLGWLQHPDAGASRLARFAGCLGLSLSRQAVDCHFTPDTASWLQSLLQRGMQQVVAGQGVPIALLQQFTGVYLEDGSRLPLPSALAGLWPAPAGRGGELRAGLHLTLRWNLLGGELAGMALQAGREHEGRSPLQSQPLPGGSLWIADSGYWNLTRLRAMQQQGVQWLLRFKRGTCLWDQDTRLDLLAWLRAWPSEQQEAERVVDLGASRQVKQVRLLVQRVSASVSQQREERMRQDAADKGYQPTEEALALCGWTVLVTSVEAERLTLSQAVVLQQARWQIELLFKLFKQQHRLDEWTSQKPWRVLCEVFAKLLALLIENWLLLLRSWQEPERSLPGVAEIVQAQVPVLVLGLRDQLPLEQAVRLLMQSVKGGCCIDQRTDRPSTASKLLLALNSSA